jgi:hypothetical protein
MLVVDQEQPEWEAYPDDFVMGVPPVGTWFVRK